MRRVFRKELADHFNSVRFLILFCLVICVAVLITNTVSMNINRELSGGAKFHHFFLMMFTTSGRFFSLTQFIAFFGPLIGIIMGFDAINKERNNGTLSKLLAQPVYRDAIINGKFLAGLVTITVTFLSLVLLIAGLGMAVLGVVPTGEEIGRLALYVVISIIYVGFWLGLSILFSILFRSIGTSALVAVALWILVSFFVGFVANLTADAFAATDGRSPEQMVRHQRIAEGVSRLSPVTLYSDATSTIIDPYRKTTKQNFLIGPMEMISMSRFNSALPLSQSILVVWPYLVSLLALTAACFGAAYAAFMRQEIRSG